VSVEDRQVVVPAGVHLDLSATTKAFMATGAAVFASRHTGAGVLVDLGGDVATYGVAPSGGWSVVLDDGSNTQRLDGEVVRLHPGEALATSRGRGLVDPRTGRPVAPLWRSISVRSSGCVGAKALAVAAQVAGTDAPELLESRGVAARLETLDGDVLRLTGWDGHRLGRTRRHLAAAS
jgi:thiamine biosynthesis lipoprotein